MGVAGVLHAWGLGAANLWLDEANSWDVARAPWRTLLAGLRTSPVGPFYFLVLRAWMLTFGDSATALRALSAVTSVALLPLTDALGRALRLPRAARWMALAFLTLSPLTLAFAQEARMYMPVAALGTACLYCYARWRAALPGVSLDPPAHPVARAWALAGYVATAVALVFTHLVGALLLLAINLDALLLVVRTRRRGPRPQPDDGRHPRAHRLARAVAPWLAAQGVIALLAGAYLATLEAGAAASTQLWRTPLGLGGAARTALLFPVHAISGLPLRPSEFHAATSDLIAGHGRWRLVLRLLLLYPLTFGVVVGALVRTALVRTADAHAADCGRDRQLLWCAVLVPLAVGATISVVRGLELPRYLLYAVPPLCLLVGDGLATVAPRARVPALAVLFGAMALGLRTERSRISRDSDYRATAALLARESRTGDEVLVQPREMGAVLAYYLRASTPRVVGVPADVALADALTTARRRASPAARTWIVIDYRSPLYELAPSELPAALGVALAADRYTADASGGVRVALVAARVPPDGGDPVRSPRAP